MLFWPQLNDGRLMPSSLLFGTVPRKSFSRWKRSVFTLLFDSTQLSSKTRLCAWMMSSVELAPSLSPSTTLVGFLMPPIDWLS